MAKTSTPKTNTTKAKRNDKAVRSAIEQNPVAFTVGGLVVGLVAGALIPRGERERKALKQVGARIAEGAKAAVEAAKETGKEQLSGATLSKDAAKESARKVLDSAVGAARGKKKSA